MPFLDGRRLHQMGEVFSPVQAFREDAPEQPKAWRESRSWAFVRRNFVLAGAELALGGQESGGQNRPGAKNGPHEHQGTADHFTNTGQQATYVHQQASYGIHDGRVIESTLCGKFT